MKIRVLVVFLLLLFSVNIFGENTGIFSLSITPGMEMPFETDPKYFTSGGGVGIDSEYRFPFLPFLGIRGNFGFSYLPIWTGDGCNLFTAGGGLTFNFPNFKKISAGLFGSVGYYYGVISDSENANGGNIYFSSGGRVGWSLTPSYNIGIQADYKYLSDGDGGALFNGMSIGVSNKFTFLSSRRIKIENIYFINVFPVLYKYYSTNSIGKATIHNVGETTMDDIEVTLFVDKYMDNPTNCPAPVKLQGGKSAEIDLFALFAEKVLDITEATVVSGKVTVSYSQKNKRYTVEHSESIRLHDRHAMIWDDDRKVAAYVTYKDPVVLDIAKSIAHMVKESGSTVDGNLSTAMALHEALRLYGMNYVIDPTTPFIEFSKNKMAVDFIQFPRNTLHYKSGDCDDLSILYTSILQAVGIDTAFITIPGHIFMAFALKLPPSEVQKTFQDPEDIIIFEDRAWVPIEITKVNSSFLEAWKTGSLQWRDNSSRNTAQLYPMYKSWEIYEPIGYIGESTDISFSSMNDVEEVYAREMDRFVNRPLFARSSALEDKLQQSTNKHVILNRLGIIYARYGRINKAREYFNQVLKIKEYSPALLNLGNIFFMEDDLNNALFHYKRVQGLKPNNSLMLLQLSRIYNELGDFTESDVYFKKLQTTSPDLAARYSYLDISQAGSGRASGQGSYKGVMLWEE